MPESIFHGFENSVQFLGLMLPGSKRRKYGKKSNFGTFFSFPFYLMFNTRITCVIQTGQTGRSIFWWDSNDDRLVFLPSSELRTLLKPERKKKAWQNVLLLVELHLYGSTYCLCCVGVIKTSRRLLLFLTRGRSRAVLKAALENLIGWTTKLNVWIEVADCKISEQKKFLPQTQ